MRAFHDTHGVSRDPKPNCTICSDCANKVTTRNNGLIGALCPLHSPCLSLCPELRHCALFVCYRGCLTHALFQLFVRDSSTSGATAWVLCPSTATLLSTCRMALDLTPLSTGRPASFVTSLTNSHLWKKRPFARLRLSCTSPHRSWQHAGERQHVLCLATVQVALGPAQCATQHPLSLHCA